MWNVTLLDLWAKVHKSVKNFTSNYTNFTLIFISPRKGAVNKQAWFLKHMLSLYLPKKLTPNFSSSWVRTILDVSLESSPSLKMSEKKIWKRYILSLAKGLSRKSKYRKIELIYLPLRPEFRHPKDQILDPPFLLLYHAFWACTRSRNHSAVTDVLAGVGSVPARVPAQSIVALSPGGELYI